MPQLPSRNPDIHSTMCRTNSRATQPSHGVVLSHAVDGHLSRSIGELAGDLRCE